MTHDFHTYFHTLYVVDKIDRNTCNENKIIKCITPESINSELIKLKCYFDNEIAKNNTIVCTVIRVNLIIDEFKNKRVNKCINYFEVKSFESFISIINDLKLRTSFVDSLNELIVYPRVMEIFYLNPPENGLMLTDDPLIKSLWIDLYEEDCLKINNDGRLTTYNHCIDDSCVDVIHLEFDTYTKPFEELKFSELVRTSIYGTF